VSLSERQRSVLASADRFEAETHAIGYWQNEPLQGEQLAFTKAFTMDTMAFAQWLQFIFLPRVREAVASNHLPSSSSVGAQGVREFDGDDKASHLLTLLTE
jgi:uncharacterized protein YqcC (DUF446 family)